MSVWWIKITYKKSREPTWTSCRSSGRALLSWLSSRRLQVSSDCNERSLHIYTKPESSIWRILCEWARLEVLLYDISKLQFSLESYAQRSINYTRYLGINEWKGNRSSMEICKRKEKLKPWLLWPLPRWSLTYTVQLKLLPANTRK